jgi:hypothetical protein
MLGHANPANTLRRYTGVLQSITSGRMQRLMRPAEPPLRRMLHQVLLLAARASFRSDRLSGKYPSTCAFVSGR